MESINNSILSVKFKVPVPRKNYVLRRKLLQKLEMMKEKELTIIKAGAGSGKTTLLSVYMKEKNIDRFRWITMDESMNQVLLFWRYIFESLQIYMEENQYLSDCLDGNMQKEMLVQLIPEMMEKLTEQEIYLVLDDFHMIHNEYVLETFNQMIDVMPAQLHIILLTRQMPGINIGALYMADELLLIEEEQMRLDDIECREFLTNTLGNVMSEEQQKRIICDANGWIGGAQLLSIAGEMKKDGHSTYISSKEQVVFDYIQKEIYDILSDEEQLFLKKTAILGYFNEEICKKYLPEYQFSHMIQLILEKNLFVVVVDEEKQEYRYHAILREFLIQKVKDRPQVYEQLCKKAADLFFSIGDSDECVRLLFQIKDYDELMQKLLEMPQNVVTFSYMMQVPMEMIVKNTNFAYQYFFCFYATMEMDKCSEIYQYIHSHMQDDETFKAFRNADLFFDVNWEFEQLSVMSLEQIQQMPLQKVTKAYILVKEAYFLFLQDRIPQAFTYLNEAERIYRESGNMYIQSFVLLEKAQMLEEYGRMNEALVVYDKMKQCLCEVPSSKVSFYIGIAGVYIRQKRMKEAKQALDLAGTLVNPKNENVRNAYLYTLAEFEYISGHPEKTEEIITTLSKNKMYQGVFFSARLLRYPIYRGKNERMAKEFLMQCDENQDALKNMDTEILYIGIVYELEDRDRTLERLDSLLARARKINNRLKIVEGTLMKIRFIGKEAGQEQRIHNLMLEAISYAVPDHIMIPFWFEKESLLPLLHDETYRWNEVMGDENLAFIIEAIRNADQHRTTENLIEELSERELQVLKEIAGGYTNKVIGEHLCISVATVKTHIINIYGKLGVNNRVDAVHWLEKQ